MVTIISPPNVPSHKSLWLQSVWFMGLTELNKFQPLVTQEVLPGLMKRRPRFVELEKTYLSAVHENRVCGLKREILACDTQPLWKTLKIDNCKRGKQDSNLLTQQVAEI